MQIYVLKDPNTNEIRYVGVTSREKLKDRLSQHVSGAKIFKNRPVYVWFNQLLREGLKPIIEKVTDIDENVWADAERYYIDYYRKLGCNLTNVDKGGSGVVKGEKRSKESIKTSSKKHKKAIYQLDINLNVIRRFDSIGDAARELKLKYANIGNAVCYHRGAYGYLWVRVDEYENYKPSVSYINQLGKGQIKI